MTDLIKDMTSKVLCTVSRIPGELELLQFMWDKWHYGGTLDQLDSAWFCPPPGSPSVTQLLEILIASGEVREEGKLYIPVKIGKRQQDQTSSESSKD